MANLEALTPDLHKRQIEAYLAVRPCYATYAEALKRVLEASCQVSFPEAFVQARAKTVSSFAEKVVRKWSAHRDAVNQFTDLCGARVIVQTTEQVHAVRVFIEGNFEILESEDKTLLLSRDEFGYRDMHYIVRLKPVRAAALGFTAEELLAVGCKSAEVQVRTWLQHAWADTLHDRMYKNKLQLSGDVKRTGALLAALMEEGDRNFNVLANLLDGLIANYTAFATREDVEKEIAVQRLILDNEVKPENRPGLALKLAGLLASLGRTRESVDLLAPHADVDGPIRGELLLALGAGLCLAEREKPQSEQYGQGRQYLEESVRLCSAGERSFVPHPRKRESLHARALARLAWALSAVPGEEHQARACFRRAHQHEPSNPYYLAAMLSFEMRFVSDRAGLAGSMATTIGEAIRTCREHALAGIELPYAYFNAGRLNLLLDRGDDALAYYARGIAYCGARVDSVPSGLRGEEVSQIRGLHFGKQPPPECERVISLLDLARGEAGHGGRVAPPVLIVAGGAASLTAELAREIAPILQTACARFRGTVVSGGTTSGVPGCIGDAARALAAAGRKRFQLLGYQPAKGAVSHPGYDAQIAVGADFLPEQMLRYWADILASGINPRDVLLLGFGGGPLSAVEYRIALGLGASVAIVAATGGAADELLGDPLWSGTPNLFPLPLDSATIRAFVIPSGGQMDSAIQEEMAKTFHERFVAGSSRRLPAHMQPWDTLEETFKRANLEQAHYAVEILQAEGFEVVRVDGPPVILQDLTDLEVERLAELEHGRWNIERLRDGWRHGRPRDDSRKIHDCLVPWDALPPEFRRYDEDAVRLLPEILAQAGLEVRRPAGTSH